MDKQAYPVQIWAWRPSLSSDKRHRQPARQNMNFIATKQYVAWCGGRSTLDLNVVIDYFRRALSSAGRRADADHDARPGKLSAL
jgi:hypothetical protein